MPLAGIFALDYWRRLLAETSMWLGELAMLCKPAKLAAIRREQLALRRRLDELADEYAKVSPAETAPC